MTLSNMVLNDTSRPIEIRDKVGRLIRVRRITALDRLRLLKAAGPDLSQNDAWLNMAVLTLAVIDVDGAPRPAPVNERQIEAAITELGDDGLQAVSEALIEGDSAASIFDGAPEGNVGGTPF